MNVLKAHLRITIDTLLRRAVPQREIARRTGVDPKTSRRHAQAGGGKLPRGGHRLFGRWHGDRRSNSPTPATGSEAGARGDHLGLRTAPDVDRGDGKRRVMLSI